MHAAACAVKKHIDAPHFLGCLFYGFVHRDIPGDIAGDSENGSWPSFGAIALSRGILDGMDGGGQFFFTAG